MESTADSGRVAARASGGRRRRTGGTREPAPPVAHDAAGDAPWLRAGRGMLRDQVYGQLRRALLSGHLAPGQGVSVRELGELVGAGAMPIRDAVHRLGSEGALEHLPNGRVRVPLVNRAEFNELIALRLLLEPFACARACAVGPPKGWRTEVTALMARRGKARAEDSAQLLWDNYRVHFSIYQASGSRHLVELIDTVWLRYGPLLIAPAASQASARLYRADAAKVEARLVDAVAERDAEYAASLMRTIIRRTEEWYAEHFEFPA